jgi:hypothetical protein
LNKALKEITAKVGRSLFHTFRLTTNQNYFANPLTINVAQVVPRASFLPTFVSYSIGAPSLTPPSPDDYNYAPHGHSLPDTIQMSYVQVITSTILIVDSSTIFIFLDEFGAVV